MSEEEVINVLIPFQIIKTSDEDDEYPMYALVNKNFTVEDVWDEGTPEYYDEATHPWASVTAWDAIETGDVVDEDISVEEVATNERL